jgi:tetratricopeptide (TPR) repeat protein
MQLLEHNKWSEAVAAFERGLDLLEDDPRLEVSLLFYRGFGLEQMRELEEAIASYVDCQAIYGRLHQELQYAAAVRQGVLLAKLKRYQEAEQHLRQTITVLQRAPESISWLQVEAFQVLAGLLLYRVPDFARAVECVQQGARAAHGLRNAVAEAGFLQAAGDGLRALGRPDEALHSYERSLDLYRRIGEGRAEAIVKRNIGLIYQSAGNWDKSLAWLQACLLDEEREQNKQGQALLCYDIACLHIDQGNLRDAGHLLQRSMSLFRQTEDHQGLDEVGRTMMGLSILMHRRMTATRLTFRDIERGSAKSKKEEK